MRCWHFWVLACDLKCGHAKYYYAHLFNENLRVFSNFVCFLFLDVHNIRNHKGQGGVARRLRSLLHSETYPSEIARKWISIFSGFKRQRLIRLVNFVYLCNRRITKFYGSGPLGPFMQNAFGSQSITLQSSGFSAFLLHLILKVSHQIKIRQIKWYTMKVTYTLSFSPKN